MIKAYLAGIASLYEGEDIEVRFCIYEDETLLSREFISKGYVKPLVVGQVALLTLLNKIKGYIDKEITISINDPALYEIVRGTSTTQNIDVLRMADKTRKELARFPKAVIKDVSKDHAELAKWDEALKR